MQKRLSFVLLIMALVLPLCFTGCFGKKKPQDLPKLYPVEIVLKLGSEPLPEALVEMVSTGNSPWYVGGRTDETGKAIMSTKGEYPGAPEGDYMVVVTKMNRIEGPTSKKPAPTDPAKLYEYRSKCDKERKMVPAILRSYSNKEKTPLTARVKADGDNTFEFTVEPFKGKGK